MMQALQGQVGGSPDLPFAGPSTTLGITGQYLELFNFLRQAYRDIQTDTTDWRWRVKQGLINLSQNKQVYTTADILAQLADYEQIVPMHFIDDQRHLLIYKTSIGVADETQCFYIVYQDWRGWKDRNVIPTSKPVYFTQHPDDALEFYANPGDAYTIVTDYRTQLDDFPLAANGIQPAAGADTYTPLYLPPRYHMTVVWGALVYWATQRERQAKLILGSKNYGRLMAQMYSEYLPDMNPYLMEYYG